MIMDSNTDKTMQLFHVDWHDNTHGELTYPHRSLPEGASAAWQTDGDTDG